MPTRREFLRRSAGLAVGLGLSPSAWLAREASAKKTPDIPWSDLASQLQGSLLRPGDTGFLAHALPWNLRYADVRPGGIAVCSGVPDVQASLAWARAHDVPLVVRSGGHSYSGFSTTTGLMIDVSSMNDLTFDSVTGRAYLGGGARNANIYASLRAPSVAVTHGRCINVGVAGLVLGGGIGFNMRRHGLTCDQLVETGMVLADGSHVVCRDDQNQDLFWACRGGGGGNFGINTSFTFQTFPVGRLTVYSITWREKVDEVLEALQDAVLATPDTFGLKVSVGARRVHGKNVLAVQLLGQVLGTRNDVLDMLAPVYAVSLPAVLDERIEEMDYWDGQDFLSDEGHPEYAHERSRFVYDRISGDGLATIFRNMRHWPGTNVAATWKFFLMGGAIAAKQPSDTAFVHRAARMISSIELEWDASENDTPILSRNEAWLAAFHAQMRHFTSDDCYQNFIDAAQGDWRRAYYGANFDRLVEVKSRYDPDDVFHFPQGIPVRRGAALQRAS